MPKKKRLYGPELQKARHAAGLTQSKLVKKLKRPEWTVIWLSGLENDRGRPNLPVLEAIAKACGCKFEIDGRGMRMV